MENEFMRLQAAPDFSGPRKAIRWITAFNFTVLAFFLITPAHTWIDRTFFALRSIHLEEPVGVSLQIWLVASTLFATVLLGRIIWLKRRAESEGLPSFSLILEATLLVAWWLTVLGASAYGFMLGIGG
jgi:hypothetical protein